MIQFLSPAGLIALLAVALPIAIHLLSRKPGKRIKIGSIRFLESTQSHRLKSLRLSEIPLLLLRAALIAVLAMLLAKPQWVDKKMEPDATQRGWILVAPELFPHLNDLGFSHSIDSLAAGNEFRLFASGFHPSSSKAMITGSTVDENYWSLLREADALAPPQTPLWIFSPDRLASFRGERAAVRASVSWRAISNFQKNHRRERAGLPPQDSPRAIMIFHGAERREDARYVRLGLEAASEFSGIDVKIKSELINAQNNTWPDAGIVFWLSDLSAPNNLMEQVAARGLLLISDAPSSHGERIESVMVMREENRLRLWRRVAASKHGVAVWTDGFGAPLLDCERAGSGFRYRFNSRFHPSWNELALSSEFPEWLLSLLLVRDGFTHDAHRANLRFDLRRISMAQLMPAKLDGVSAPGSNAVTASLHLPLWILALLLFVAERWMAERKLP